MRRLRRDGTSKYGDYECNRVLWGNVSLVCNAGRWIWGRTQSFSSDAWYTADSNASWSSNGNSISTGWNP